jgi:hypothetical protein
MFAEHFEGFIDHLLLGFCHGIKSESEIAMWKVESAEMIFFAASAKPTEFVSFNRGYHRQAGAVDAPFATIRRPFGDSGFPSATALFLPYVSP